jgi:hypothetical protein
MGTGEELQRLLRAEITPAAAHAMPGKDRPAGRMAQVDLPYGHLRPNALGFHL